MAIKLGEMLVKGGVITPAQLDEVLKCQVIFGGKLGTNLIEMGYLQEDELVVFLSQKLGVPCARPEQLMSIPPDVIKLIPPEIAEKFRVIPLRLDNKRLTIAMTDPTDFAAIDQLSFITGFIIIPLVSPELRVFLALEKYYGFKREVRYIPVTGGVRSKIKEGQSDNVTMKKMQEHVAPAVNAESVELPFLSELSDADLIPVDDGGTESPRSTPPMRYSLDNLSMRLADAKERDEIINAVIDYLGQEFGRTAFFIVKGNVAEGVKALLQRKDVPGFKECSVNLNDPSVLKVVVEGKSFYLGPVPETLANSAMLSRIGGVRPAAALLLPIMMMARLVSIIYLDGGKGELGESLPELQKIVGKVSLAFEMIILRNKIMMT